jgi:hypothetical protein
MRTWPVAVLILGALAGPRAVLAAPADSVGGVAAALLTSTTSEGNCQSGRAKAAATYAACAPKALAWVPLSPKATGGCATRYEAKWAKLQAKASGSGATCDNPRFADNGDGTVTDRLTALQWEKKSNLDGIANPADPHDADNLYTWSAGGPGSTAADGTAFTSFLATLNGAACFASQCDWRLPTRRELQTIVTAAYPACTTRPCIDPAFGPTVDNFYWSATTLAFGPSFAWAVSFGNVDSNIVYDLDKTAGLYLRAVRSGF